MGNNRLCAEKEVGKLGRKWLFFDIDGTLVPYGEDARPSTRTLDALAALRAQGHKVFLCTGRTKCDIGSTLLCFDVDGVIPRRRPH